MVFQAKAITPIVIIILNRKILLKRIHFQKIKDPIWEKPIGIWRHGQPKPVTNRPMTADTWQRFKRDFIAKYDGEEVKETGFTDSEFLEWFKTGKRELHKEPSKLEALLAELHSHKDAAEGDDDEE